MTFDELRQAIDDNGGPGDEIIAQVMAGEVHLFGGPDFSLVWFANGEHSLKVVFFTGSVERARQCVMISLTLGFTHIDWDGRHGWSKVMETALTHVAIGLGEGFKHFVDVNKERQM